MCGYDDEDDEKFTNLMLFNVYATDKEIEEMAPFLLVCLSIAAIIFLIIYFCGGC